MTRLLLFCISVFMVGITEQSIAQQTQWSAGFLVGSPSGLSVKNFFKKDESFHGGLAIIQKVKTETHLFAGIEFHESDWIDIQGDPLTAFYGVGVKAFSGNSNGLGVRGSAGLEYHVPGFPVAVFIDLAPVFFLIPATSFTLDTGIGVHYRF